MKPQIPFLVLIVHFVELNIVEKLEKETEMILLQIHENYIV